MVLVQAWLVPLVTNDTSTTTYELPDPQTGGAQDTVSQMPWAGTIKRIWLGHTDTIGEGAVQMVRYAGGLFTGAVNLPVVNFTGTAGPFTEIIEYDEDFEKDDGLRIRVIRSTDMSSIHLTITLEIEFSMA